MLFQIDGSVSEALTSEPPAREDIAGIGYLLLGVAEGSHRITGERAVLRQLAGLNSIGDRERKTLERALGRMAQEGHLAYSLRTVGKVVATAATQPSVSIVGQRTITFPLRWFDRSAKIQPVTLLGENLSDVEIYKRMGEVGILLDGLGYLPIQCSPSSGGGSTTGMILEHLHSQQRVCICVVDSDKASPTGEMGATAKSVARFKDTVNYPSIHVLETEARDLENLLPDVFYTMTYARHPAYQRLAHLLSSLTAQGEVGIRSYLDLEKGLVLHDILNLAAGSPEHQFWTASQQSVWRILGSSPQSLPCHTQTACLQTNRNLCTCVVVRGIATNVLEDFIAFASGKDRFAQRTELDDSVRPEWIRIGAEIGSWCCADDRLRV